MICGRQVELPLWPLCCKAICRILLKPIPAGRGKTVVIWRYVLLGLIGLPLIFVPNESNAQNAFRGKLLYENHCLECHDSIVHIREERKVHSPQKLSERIHNWSTELNLTWGRRDISDVASYLDQQFYQFKPDTKSNPMTMNFISTGFWHNAEIPIQFTCDGLDVSPALSWSNLPIGSKSLALIVEDPDAPDPAAPKMIWTHWVLYNIPSEQTGLAEAVEPVNLPKGTKQGLNDWKETGYRGPCPPVGSHRYFYKLFVLDRILPDLNSPTKEQLEQAMQGHVLEYAELMGTYKRR